MTWSLSHLKRSVRSFLPLFLITMILHFLDEHSNLSNFWGIKKAHEDFIPYIFFLTLHKDRNAIGYHELHSNLAPTFKTALKSVVHNVRAMRKLLYNWSKTQIVSGNMKSWKRTGVEINFVNVPKEDQNGKIKAHLLLDSSDFRKSGRCSTS